MMKTIFITSFHVLISRNILGTPLLSELTRDPDTRVVLFVPDYKRGYFEREFGSPQVIVAGVKTELSRWDRALRQFSLILLPTRSMAIKRHWEFLGSRRAVPFALKSAAARLLAGRGWARRLLRRLDRRTARSGRFAPLFREHRPDAVFAADVQNELDLELMREAKRAGIPAIGMVRSWDNLTSKGMMRIIPDCLIVHNDRIRDEAVRYHGVPPGAIAAIGIPHYDRYHSPRPTPRAEFFASLGLDPAKRLILFAPVGDRYIRGNVTDRAVLEELVRGRQEGRLPLDVQVLVRLPPMDAVNLDGFMPPPWIKIERPGVSFRPGAVKESEIGGDDDRRLLDSLAYCDCAVTGPSTIAVDAAYFDKPVVLVDFDNNGAGYWWSAAPWYDYTHFRPIIASAGVRVAKNGGELLQWVGRYLEHPKADRAGREKIRAEQCEFLDGQSTRRLAEVIAGAVAGRRL